MSDESKAKRDHEEKHPHHHNPHKHPQHKDDDSPAVHPAWYIVLGGVLIIIIVLSWMMAATY